MIVRVYNSSDGRRKEKIRRRVIVHAETNKLLYVGNNQ